MGTASAGKYKSGDQAGVTISAWDDDQFNPGRPHMTLGGVANETRSAPQDGSLARTVNPPLKGSPLLLVIVILNAGMIFTLMYVASAQREERQMLTKILVENCQAR